METPTFLTEEISGVLVLSVQDTLLGDKSEAFLRALREIGDSDRNKVVVNLDKCDYTSSANLAALVQCKKKMLSRGGDLKIARANGVIRALFQSTNLSRVFEVFSSVEFAVTSFEGKSVN
jgi:anti-sigma B factor antagonist